MTQPTDPFAPAIGACLSCRQLFLITPETPNCILCGRPPAYALELTLTDSELIKRAQDKPAEPIPSTAPSEELSPAVEEPPPAAGEEPAEAAPETIKASEVLPVVIHAFLVGDEAVDAETLKGVFEDTGADPEATATAVGRLVAVRELILTLRVPEEPAPVAPAPPQVTPP